MIDGLKIHLTTDKLRAHLETKVAAIVREAGILEASMAENDKQAKRIEDAGGHTRPAYAVCRHSRGGAGTFQLDRLRAQADRLQFIADHLVPDETYCLSDVALEALEPSSRPFQDEFDILGAV